MLVRHPHTLFYYTHGSQCSRPDLVFSRGGPSCGLVSSSYFKAKEEPIARQHMHTCRFSLIMKSKNHSVLFWNFQGFFWVQWKVRWFLWLALELQAANYSFNETSGTVILSLCMSAHSCCGMHMCVCICWMIREWDPRIHSLECEVCVLSGPRGKECLPNSL